MTRSCTLRSAGVLCAAILLATVPAALLQAQERVDVPTIERIRAEETQRSQVMDIVSWLTDVHGPRLTGSPITKQAAEWAMTAMRSWGLANPHIEEWSPFGRSWTSERFYAQVVAPHPYPIIAYPGAWSIGTSGPVAGDVVRVALTSQADLDANRGKLRGKWLMSLTPPTQVSPHFTPEALRRTDEQLQVMGAAVLPPPAAARTGDPDTAALRRQMEFSRAREKFIADEAPLGVLQNARGDGGNVFLTGPGLVPPYPVIAVSAEHYGRMWRTLERHVPVRLEVNSAVKYYDSPGSFNILAEIPGVDPALKDEVVMIGAHFDSWSAGTGATDNAAGCAVMMEAMRLIQTLSLKPRRTIRIGLWTGEEEGLIGSRMYVRQHFGYIDSTGAQLTPEHTKLAAYFNLDNGTGKIRGVFLQANAEVAPIFDAWMAPFKDDGMRTLTIANAGGTDHLSFDALGLPGFQFIQDQIDYETRTHHSSQDVYERIQPEDMKFNSIVLATFAWQAAQRDERLPRKPLPHVGEGRGGTR